MKPEIIPQKKLGQNFLLNQGVIEKIVSAISPKKGDLLIEIGPGLGALTFPLLKITKELTAIEIDPRFLPGLKNKSASIGTLTVYHQDALQVNFSSFTEQPHSLRILGNLPYYISTPLLFHLIKEIHWIKDMHFMLQKEVADRITAQPGSKLYGRLSIMIQYYCNAKKLFNVSAASFFPKPKIDSSVISLIPFNTLPHPAHNFEHFKILVREAFNHRRKMLSHTLQTLSPIKSFPWDAVGINPKSRAETLSVKDFVNVSNFLQEQRK